MAFENLERKDLSKKIIYRSRFSVKEKNSAFYLLRTSNGDSNDSNEILSTVTQTRSPKSSPGKSNL